MSVIVNYHPDSTIQVDFTAMTIDNSFGSWNWFHSPVGNGPTLLQPANHSLGHMIHFVGPVIPLNAIILNAFYKTSYWGAAGIPPWGAGGNATGKITANKALALVYPSNFTEYQALVRTPTVVPFFPIANVGAFLQIPNGPEQASFAQCIQDVISALGNNGELTFFVEDNSSPAGDVRYFYVDTWPFPGTTFLHIEYNVPVPVVPSSFEKKLFATGAI